jgi:menaquinone-9 beta-reductase
VDARERLIDRNMEACDVLIVGGGPAGSACAWKLRSAGLDVVVMDKAAFPRDKVCAGWITPQVVEDLQIDEADYRAGRTFQPITGFRVGIIGRDDAVDVSYDRPVSFGIRRCEFDHYLLRRSGARVLVDAVSTIRHAGATWVVNDRIEAAMLVGAGGHFCPVARLLNGPAERTPLVAAQEAEFPIDQEGAAEVAVAGERPELYFCRDFSGYGWCFRKEQHLNVGFGRIRAHALPRDTSEFVAFLRARRRIAAGASWPWRGHAYLIAGRRHIVGDGVALVGDAAGLAYPQSGEGIRPAIESGLMAASVIADASGDYGRERLDSYANEVKSRFGTGTLAGSLSRAVSAVRPDRWAASLLRMPWFVRRVVLDRWFLHAGQPALYDTHTDHHLRQFGL